MKIRNIYFDSYGLARAGKHSVAKEILSQNYPDASEREISEAVDVGKKLNQELWVLADDYYERNVTEKEIKDRISAICPRLDQAMVDHIYASALYDAK